MKQVIDPEDEMDEGMLDGLEGEYMALAEKGDRAAFDFALEFSDRVNDSARGILMGLMTAAALNEDLDASLALWSRCARQAFLDVLAKESAPQWARAEYARRHQQNLEMQDSWLDRNTDDYRDLV